MVSGVDLRGLAAFRIAFGLTLIGNWAIRISNGKLVAHYSDAGVLPMSLVQETSSGTRWSFLDAFTSPAAVSVAFALILLVYLAFTAGFYTRVAQLLVPVCLVALYHRNPLIDDGSDWTLRLWAVWAVFLPLGERFSIDAWRSRRPPAYADRAPLVWWLLLANLAIQYVLNAYQKNGPGWKDGTALRYVFWDPWVVTDAAVWARAHLSDAPIYLLTKGALALELALALAIALSPFTRHAKRAAALLIVAIHAGFAIFLYIGTFAYAFMSLSLLFVPSEDWDRVSSRGSRRYRSPGLWKIATGCGAAAFAALCAINLCANNPRVAKPLKERALALRAPLDGVHQLLMITQEWFMFRNPPPRIGTVVIYVERDDGVAEDLLRPGPFDMFRPVRSSAHIGKYWVSYWFRMQLPQYDAFRDALASHLFAGGVARFAVGEVWIDVPSAPQSEPSAFGARYLFGATRAAPPVASDVIGSSEGVKWSAGSGLSLRFPPPSDASEWVEVAFDVVHACHNGSIGIDFSRGPVRGAVDLSLNGGDVVARVDAHARSGAPGHELVRKVALASGKNVLRIAATQQPPGHGATFHVRAIGSRCDGSREGEPFAPR